MLADLVAGALEDAAERQNTRSLEVVEAAATAAPPALDALSFLAPAENVKIIAEVKRASPSRGPLATIADPADLAARYAAGGAGAISVLTEQRRFKGSLDDLVAVRAAVDIPVLSRRPAAPPGRRGGADRRRAYRPRRSSRRRRGAPR